MSTNMLFTMTIFTFTLPYVIFLGIREAKKVRKSFPIQALRIFTLNSFFILVWLISALAVVHDTIR